MVNFEDWCYHAVAEIRFKPDREAVFQELKAHLEDHYDEFLAQGYTPEKAQRLAMEAMGNPEDIAPQLGEIHKPWLGYLYRTAKWIAAVVGFWAVFLLVSYFCNHIHAIISTANYDSLRAEGEGGYYGQPNVSDISDGYRFKVTEAAVSSDGSTLHLELQITYWFWMREPAVINHFWAVDSLGNNYQSRMDAQYADIPKVSWGGGFHTQGFRSDHLEISHFDSRAEWVELHYDRDGRDIVLRIYLSGGDDA